MSCRVSSCHHRKGPENGTIPRPARGIGFEELIAALNGEAERLSKELGGTAKLMAKGLDLRPRLGTEKGVSS